MIVLCAVPVETYEVMTLFPSIFPSISLSHLASPRCLFLCFYGYSLKVAIELKAISLTDVLRSGGLKKTKTKKKQYNSSCIYTLLCKTTQHVPLKRAIKTFQQAAFFIRKYKNAWVRIYEITFS